MINQLPPRLPTEEEWAGWLLEPQTQILIALAEVKKQEIQEDWGKGSFTFPDCEKTALKSAEKIGEITVWSLLLELNHQRLINEIGEEYGEYFRARAGWPSGPGPDIRAGAAPRDDSDPRPR